MFKNWLKWEKTSQKSFIGNITINYNTEEHLTLSNNSAELILKCQMLHENFQAIKQISKRKLAAFNRNYMLRINFFVSLRHCDAINVDNNRLMYLSPIARCKIGTNCSFVSRICVWLTSFHCVQANWNNTKTCIKI